MVFIVIGSDIVAPLPHILLTYFKVPSIFGTISRTLPRTSSISATFGCILVTFFLVASVSADILSRMFLISLICLKAVLSLSKCLQDVQLLMKHTYFFVGSFIADRAAWRTGNLMCAFLE